MKKNLTLLALFLFSATLFAQKPIFESTLKNLTGWGNLDKSSKKSGNKWVISKNGPTGAFKIPKIKSSTAADGFALFDSDTYCSNSQNAWLVTPTINCSANPIVFLTFQQTYRRFIDTCWVNVSADNGTTWTKFPINQEYDNNQGPKQNPEAVEMDISSVAANKAQVKIAFQFGSDDPSDPLAGCGYSWMIDDVKVLPVINNSLAIVNSYFPASTLVTPVTQIADDTMAFFVKVKNNGIKDQPNVKLKVTVKDAKGKNYFSDSLQLATVPTDIETTQDSFLFLPNTFVPSKLGVGRYTVEYSFLSKDSVDISPSNNRAIQTFVISEDLFAQDTIPTTSYRPSVAGDYAMGNLYKTAKSFGNNAFKASNVYFTCSGDNGLEGKPVSVFLYKMSADVLPDLSNFEEVGDLSTHPQLSLIGLASYEFTAGDKNDDIFKLPLIDNVSGNEGVALEANTRYIILVSYAGDASELYQGFSEGTDMIYHNYYSILYSEGLWSRAGFGSDVLATVRMDLSMAVDVKDVNLEDNVFSVSPNPTTENINVSLNFDAPNNILITIADQTGKIVKMQEVKNATKEKVNIDVNTLPVGSYLIRIVTENGFKTKQFSIVR